jgi:hypothetical protein
MPKDITAHTRISGLVNNHAFTGKVDAVINTGRGGRSSCEFTHLPPGFTPATLGNQMWTTHHTSAGLSRIGDDVANLYDLTRGNYHVLRAIIYPEYPESLLVIDVQVKASRNLPWTTHISIHGTYHGPTDVTACKNYQLEWAIAGKQLLESGNSTLELSSGKTLRQVWFSIISPKGRARNFPPSSCKFPSGGEVIKASISPFKIDGQKMSYAWEGTVRSK